MIAAPASPQATAPATSSSTASGAAADLTSSSATADPLAALFQNLLQTFSVAPAEVTVLAAPLAEEQELAELAEIAPLLPATAPDFSPAALLQHLDAADRLQTTIHPDQGSTSISVGGALELPAPTPLSAALVRDANSRADTGPTDAQTLGSADSSTTPPQVPAVGALGIPMLTSKEVAVTSNFSVPKAVTLPRPPVIKSERNADGTNLLAAGLANMAPQKSLVHAPVAAEPTTTAGTLFSNVLPPETEAAVTSTPAVAAPARRPVAPETLSGLPPPGPIDMVAAGDSTRSKSGIPAASVPAKEQSQGLPALEATRTTPVAGESGAAPALAQPATVESASVYRSAIAAHPAAPSFPAELSSELRLLVKSGIQHAELSMNPVELGPIRIELSVSSQTADISFTATNVVTRDGITQSLPQLREMLSSQGIGLGQTHVGAEAQGQKHAAQEGNAPKSSFPGTLAAPTGVAPSSGSMASMVSRHNGLLDLYA
jgi:flagellar hook-length control protein FliK